MYTRMGHQKHQKICTSKMHQKWIQKHQKNLRNIKNESKDIKIYVTSMCIKKNYVPSTTKKVTTKNIKKFNLDLMHPNQDTYQMYVHQKSSIKKYATQVFVEAGCTYIKSYNVT